MGGHSRPGSLLASESAGYWVVKTSPVIGINQTNHFTNQERPCTTPGVIQRGIQPVMSLPRAIQVTFPVLSQIKPHTPRLVVPFRQFL